MFAGVIPGRAALCCAALLFLGTGCTSTGRFAGGGDILQWAHRQGFARSAAVADSDAFIVLTRASSRARDDVAIYIEGDGAPWPRPHVPPADPTPLDPVALRLAARDERFAVAYFGRPCQYREATALARCNPEHWTERRFAPEVIVAYDQAISRVKTELGARRVRLIGFSGGGVLAVLVAARRDDVASVTTVAAPLSLADWSTLHEVTPLTGSVDPADPALKLDLPRSMHFVGARDPVVPPVIVEAFVRRRGGRMHTVPDASHECCWVERWDALRRAFLGDE